MSDDYVVGGKTYYVTTDNRLAVGTIEKIEGDLIYSRITMPDTTVKPLPFCLSKENNPWPFFNTALGAIEYAIETVVYEINDLADELADAHIKKARLESLYTEQIGLGPMVEFEDTGEVL